MKDRRSSYPQCYTSATPTCCTVWPVLRLRNSILVWCLHPYIYRLDPRSCSCSIAKLKAAAFENYQNYVDRMHDRVYTFYGQKLRDIFCLGSAIQFEQRISISRAQMPTNASLSPSAATTARPPLHVQVKFELSHTRQTLSLPFHLGLEKCHVGLEKLNMVHVCDIISEPVNFIEIRDKFDKALS